VTKQDERLEEGHPWAALLASLDPLLVAAADDVDRSLLTWTAAMSPRERLRVATRAQKALSRFRRASA
jgi:hypothetical protein